MDYQVEDIVAIEQLDELAPLASETETSPTEENPVVQSDIIPSITDEQALLNLNENTFVIQIAGMSDKQVLQEFVTDFQLQNEVWIYTTKRYGGDWSVLIFKENYSSLEQARNAATTLSPAMQRGTPFAKTVKQVHQEISLYE